MRNRIAHLLQPPPEKVAIPHDLAVALWELASFKKCEPEELLAGFVRDLLANNHYWEMRGHLDGLEEDDRQL